MNVVATLKGMKCPQCESEELTIKGKVDGVGNSVVGTILGGAIVQLAVSKNASKNVETTPIAFVCLKCKHKFQSYPLNAPLEDMLDAPCTIQFTRLGSMVGAALAQFVYLNGVNCGPVKNGKTITLQTGNRWNTLYVTDHYGVASPSVYRFEAAPGGTIAVKFRRKFVQ
ncbi:MAG: hypothetical protein ACOX2M_08520 [Fastidiosipilaceae bacterium]